jgi:hypothetical protein
MHALTNTHNPKAKESHFHDEHESALKPQIIPEYNQHMGYADKGDRMIKVLNPMADMEVKEKQKLFSTATIGQFIPPE